MLLTPSQRNSPESVPPLPGPHFQLNASKITRGHSCILCQQRKVKCDRQKPCSNCVKARVDCIPSVPTAPRRRRRKFSEQDTASRLKRCEQLLKKHGIRYDDDDDSPLESTSPGTVITEEEFSQRNLINPPPRAGDRGMLYSDKGTSHYIENTLWENLRDEIEDPKEALQLSSDDDEINESGMHPEPELFCLGHRNASKDLKTLHPRMVHIFRLWQVFLDNVQPLVKIFHAPTTQQLILQASADLDNVAKPTEALMFCIYLLAVTSLEEQDCQAMLGDSRDSLLSKFSHAAQQALINARFMKSLNMLTLQALILYALAVPKYYDPHSFYILTGMAVRIAQRLGIHKDGALHKISPFETEFRRRTWWQVVFLDGQSSKLAGAGFPAHLLQYDTKLPTNVSDSDLNPNMTEMPSEKEGVTEMLALQLRYEVATAMKSFTKGGNNNFWSTITNVELIVKKDMVIDELEAKFEEKYIRFCDPSIPLHLFAIYMSKAVICAMRHMAHHPRQYPDRGANMPAKEKDMLFTEALKEIELSTMGFRSKAIRGFMWHLHVQFQLNPFVHLLSELRHRVYGAQVDRAWEQIELAFDQRPEMLLDNKNSLYLAIGNLALKAWAKREGAGGLYRGSQLPAAPRFVSVLRSQRNNSTPVSTPSTTELRQPSNMKQMPQPSEVFDLVQTAYPNTVHDAIHGMQQIGGWNPNNYAIDMNMQDLVTEDWEYYQTLLDGELPTYYGNAAQQSPHSDMPGGQFP
ncbi:fungal-specific transcription factor domain-containing protein [Calycina marina]|uniref:Fungal-specific transcription factor domain-containing protein n=1 Tax=Calycina marina TaxID=1763456 RepID=A0A9P7YV51_9HELO|nr:fungal-specific transcription factor domain-containing protein [Calycina marina]